MSLIKIILGVVLILAIVGVIYVRLVPSYPARWHVEISETEDADFATGALRVIEIGPDGLARADAYMRALPRTRVLAGSIDENHITFITRSRVFGFPDYTTLDYRDGTLRALARLRFGGSDMGVNRERLEGLVAALE